MSDPVDDTLFTRGSRKAAAAARSRQNVLFLQSFAQPNKAPPANTSVTAVDLSAHHLKFGSSQQLPSNGRSGLTPRASIAKRYP